MRTRDKQTDRQANGLVQKKERIKVINKGDMRRKRGLITRNR